MSDDLPFDDVAGAPPLEPTNVLEFRKRTPQEREALEALARQPRDATACAHRRTRLVDDQQRTVTCGECGATLDPIWCLLNLIEYRETLKRERSWIESEKRRLEERRQAAIARRVAAKTKAALVKTKAECQACGGSGWMAGAKRSDPARRCGCRTTAAKLL